MTAREHPNFQLFPYMRQGGWFLPAPSVFVSEFVLPVRVSVAGNPGINGKRPPAKGFRKTRRQAVLAVRESFPAILHHNTAGQATPCRPPRANARTLLLCGDFAPNTSKTACRRLAGWNPHRLHSFGDHRFSGFPPDVVGWAPPVRQTKTMRSAFLKRNGKRRKSEEDCGNKK